MSSRRRRSSEASPRWGAADEDAKKRRKAQNLEQERKMRDLEDARRDDMTVLVANISLRATEQDINEFFSKNAGKVRAVKLIKDSRSGKSKGIGYVEFDDSTAVLKSLGLTGQQLMGQPLRVQTSQAEKNRAARAVKAQQDLASAQAPTKLYIGNLVNELADLSVADVDSLFSPFGSIIHIDVPKDKYTMKNKGYAFVQFSDSEHARDAMLAMHGFEISGRKLKVGFAVDEAAPSGVIEAAAAPSPDRQSEEITEKPPAHCSDIICLNNMYNKFEVQENGTAVIDEIEEDVMTECLKFGIVIDVRVQNSSSPKFTLSLQMMVNADELDGKIYVRFVGMTEAREAYKALNGRYFGGEKIEACFVDPIEFLKMKSK